MYEKNCCNLAQYDDSAFGFLLRKNERTGC